MDVGFEPHLRFMVWFVELVFPRFFHVSACMARQGGWCYGTGLGKTV